MITNTANNTSLTNMTIKQPRQSNIELLRIISMLMVLLVHANFFSLGKPTVEEVIEQPIDASLRVLFECVCIPCVDIFVLISGWFGIKANKKGLCNFLFQVAF